MNIKILPVFLLLLLFFHDPVFCRDSVRKTSWLPKGNLYPSILLDYKESQISGSLYSVYSFHQFQNQAMGNFSLGFRYNITRWQHSFNRASELGFEISIFPQFIFEDPFGKFQANLFNIDFKIGIHYQVMIERWRFRGRLYHISTHLGDDYIYRYGIEEFLYNTRIYEALDLSAAWENRSWQFYGTAGVIVHSAYPREPLLFQAGAKFSHPVKGSDYLQWIAATDFKFEQEQDFRPCFRIGAGIGIGKNGKYPLVIMADYYNGYLPYSLYDRMLVQWIGASLFLNPF